MEPSNPDPLSEVRRREDGHIQRDLARVGELTAIVSRFHERAREQPELWRDPVEAPRALGAAQELRSAENELHILYVQQIGRREAQLRALAAIGKVGESALEPMDNGRRFRGEALLARDGFESAIHRLRSVDPSDPLMQRADRERRARLRWLLTLLAEIQPEVAQTLERTWKDLRSRPSDDPGPRVERRERQMGDSLVLFLEPLLPE